MAFFDCHRKIVFREAEGEVWARDYKKGKKPKLSTYAIPMASPDEILIEKTPHIMNRGYDKLKARAELMKKTMKGVKVLAMLCDPIKRFISLEKHHTPVNWSATTRDKLTVSHIKKHIKSFMNYNKQKGITGTMTRPTAGEMTHHKMPNITGITGLEWNNLRYGNFYHQLLPFYEVFGEEGMIFLDGTNMGMIRN